MKRKCLQVGKITVSIFNFENSGNVNFVWEFSHRETPIVAEVRRNCSSDRVVSRFALFLPTSTEYMHLYAILNNKGIVRSGRERSYRHVCRLYPLGIKVVPLPTAFQKILHGYYGKCPTHIYICLIYWNPRKCNCQLKEMKVNYNPADFNRFYFIFFASNLMLIVNIITHAL